MPSESPYDALQATKTQKSYMATQKDPFDEKLREIGDVIKEKYISVTDESQKLVFFNKYIAHKVYPPIKGFAKK